MVHDEGLRPGLSLLAPQRAGGRFDRPGARACYGGQRSPFRGRGVSPEDAQNGTQTASLFRRRRSHPQCEPRRRGTAYRPASAQPPDPESGGRAGGQAAGSERATSATDRGGPLLLRTGAPDSRTSRPAQGPDPGDRGHGADPVCDRLRRLDPVRRHPRSRSQDAGALAQSSDRDPRDDVQRTDHGAEGRPDRSGVRPGAACGPGHRACPAPRGGAGPGDPGGTSAGAGRGAR